MCEAVVECHACVKENHTTHCITVLLVFVWPGGKGGGEGGNDDGRDRERREGANERGWNRKGKRVEGHILYYIILHYYI